MRVLALDHGSARCGCAVSDPTGLLARPLEVVERPDSEQGLRTLRSLCEREGCELVLVGLPRDLSGAEGPQEREATAFAERLRGALEVEVELVDERFTTRLAERTLREARAAGIEGAAEDSLAAAHLLQGWLDARTGSVA